jgi:hypothetical protein
MDQDFLLTYNEGIQSVSIDNHREATYKELVSLFALYGFELLI